MKTHIKVKNRKEAHPFETANIVSKLCFTWMFPLFIKGFKRGLSNKDLYPPLQSHESSYLGDKLECEWKKELKRRPQHPSLGRCLTNVFGKQLLVLGIFYLFVEMIVRLGQPQFLSKLLEYFEPNSTMPKIEAYCYAGAIAICSAISQVFQYTFMLHNAHLGLKIRVATSALVYRKALSLSKSALTETTVGQMVNLISNDVSRFETGVNMLHNIWMAPLETVVVLIMIYFYVGPTGMVGVTALLFFIPFQTLRRPYHGVLAWLGKKTSEFRLATAMRTDERIRLMNEIILGMQVIKMYTWEKPFATLVEISRRKEMAEIKKMSIIRAIQISFSLFLNRTALYLCILVYVLTGHTLNAQYVYILQSFYNILRGQITMSFPQAVTQIAEARISVKRIKNFLQYDEIDTSSIFDNTFESTFNVDVVTEPNILAEIRINNASFKWTKSRSENSLENIDLHLESPQHAAVIGSVGSGKTTLLHAILGELSPVKGNVTVTGSISYASQESWLFVGSVRQNILFGQKFDAEKYNKIVNICQLERDFSLLPYGDQTIVEERGVSLSGGQRSRINLARAVYKDADIYLLDDPLSAVDAHVGKIIFEECISRYLRNKCVLLVTHQLQYLRNIQRIYFLDHGEIHYSGSYEEIQSFNTHFIQFLNDPGQSLEEEANKEVIKMGFKEVRSKSEDNRPTETKECMGKGTIAWDVYKFYFICGGHWWKTFSLFIVFVICQTLASFSDILLSTWVNMNQFQEHSETLRSINSPSLKGTLSGYTLVTIYSAMIFGIVILSTGRSLAFYRIFNEASIRLHNSMFYKIVYATMRFFNTNPSGRILNRFSKDMNQVDEVLPLTLLDTVQIALNALAIMAVIATVNPWLLVPAGVMLIIFYLLRVVFLASSRDIKRLEGVARSPVYSHLTMSLQGLTTIRAFGAQNMLKDQFDNYQNTCSSAYFMFLAANRTFGFWLDVHCILFITLVTFNFLLFDIDVLGGDVGMAISQAIVLTGMFQWGMRQWSELENTMTCVERVKEYADVTPEPNNDVKPPNDWPHKGNIVFDHLSLRYNSTEPYVLRNLSFSISSGEKVGIVGRTGAGKSSIIIALFRLAINDGTIFIDDVDISTISLTNLRSSISIIPQEPILFSGSLRKNLDPFDAFSDKILWNALEEVKLKSAVSELPQGLESRISEGGCNFSVGQKQLVCLARAIIRNNKILVLDEATANIDPHTDGLIQSTIRRKFANCTVLTIAHRLSTIMDSDKVLVVDSGTIVEFGHPHNLLQDNGPFYELVRQTGKAMAESLSYIAAENYYVSKE